MRAHYHVIAGTPGYLPYHTAEDSGTFTSRRDAEAYAHDFVTEKRHEPISPEVWYGNVRDGYIRKARDNYDLGEYVEVVSCLESECVEAEAGE